jgi:hypothetical protein
MINITKKNLSTKKTLQRISHLPKKNIAKKTIISYLEKPVFLFWNGEASICAVIFAVLHDAAVRSCMPFCFGFLGPFYNFYPKSRKDKQ